MAKFKAKKTMIDMIDKKTTKKNNHVLKEKKIRSEEESEAIRFFVILAIVIIVIFGIYFLSKAIVNKRNKEKEETNTVSINYDIVSVGTILNRENDNYYVFIYDEDSVGATYYNRLLESYKNASLKPIYYCNLNNQLNKPYVAKDGKSNPNATKTSEFAFGEVTLLEIDKGKVKNYYEDIKQISDLLNVS